MGTINNREFTRHDFRPKMWVKILRPNQEIDQFKMFRLLDISKGGVSFIINNPTEFKRNDIILILEVEDRVLQVPIKAIVKYVWANDEFGVDYKVGIEFLLKAKKSA